MPDISLRDLLDAGVHFGHQTRRWNPKMKGFIFGEKNGIHIINLQQTAIQLAHATNFVSEAVARGQKVLFVGTKRQAADIVSQYAEAADQFHVTHRWLGGMLTNFKTVKGSIDRLNKLEKDQAEGKFEGLSKKERLSLERQRTKLKNSLGGIQDMTALPGVIFVIDPKKEHIAVKEARRLGIPIVAVCDTNCDPDGISFVIPGNDDALKAIKLFAAAVSDACIEGRQMAKDFARREYANLGAANVNVVAEPEGPGPEVVVKSQSDELAADVAAEAAAPEAAVEAAAPEAAVEAAAPEAAVEEAAPEAPAAEAAAPEAPAEEAPAAVEAPAVEAAAPEAPAAEEAPA
jgi:small subunit ribosomal protein S2